VHTVIVRQESSQAGVAAEIYRLDDHDVRALFVTVDDSGRGAPDKLCAPDDRFVVNPRTPAYLKVEARHCAETIDFELPSAETSYALVIKGDEAAKIGDFGKAQAFYSLAASRFAVSQPAESRALQDKARIAAGRALKVAKPTVQINSEEKLTEETKEKLRAFQVRRGLDQTGVLDTPTQTALSGFTAAQAIESAHTVPPEAVKKFVSSPMNER